MLTKQEYKQLKELDMVSAILRDKGIAQDACICSDRPDILIRINNTETIGVEVVTYRSSNNAEAENAFYKQILQEYVKILDSKNEKRYLVSIQLKSDFLSNIQIFKKAQKEIFMEINLLRNQPQNRKQTKYIDEVSFEEINIRHSEVIWSFAYIFTQVEENKLIQVIDEKNKKLCQYKALQQNSEITEWWLVVFFPESEHTDFRNLSLTMTIQSDYNHIFLTEYTGYKQIK